MNIKISELERDIEKISSERKKELQRLADLIKASIQDKGYCKLNFICTHNSRRSQLAELWTLLACKHYDLKRIEAFSGGTESTAFNHRMVKALQRAGLQINIIKEGNNPVYVTGSFPSHKFFSKRYDDPFNPRSNYIAVMVCDHADLNCPIVHGASYRFSLKYKDPKAYDDTPEESRAYDEKINEVGREILYLVSFLVNNISL